MTASVNEPFDLLIRAGRMVCPAIGFDGPGGVAMLADKEEEIRIEAERQLAFIEREAGITLEKKHEFTIAKGRADSVYTRVVIELKQHLAYNE